MPKKTRTSSKKTAKRSATTAKKNAAKRAPSKKKAPARKTTTRKKVATKKVATKKVATRKKTAKTSARKAASKKATKKTPTKKAAPKKKTGKKVTKKPAAKKATKKPASKKTTTKKSTSKKVTSKKTSANIAASRKTATKKAASTKSSGQSSSNAKAADDKGKPNRKGITIVSDRPKKRSAPKKVVTKFPPTGDRLLGPGSPIRKPLIPSGPSRAEQAKHERKSASTTTKKAKSPFTKRELDKFKAILLAKRAELFGDMSQMESGALRSSSGGLSHTPQHFAEQGSDSYDQSLALDLAAADRRLIIEIDDALQRIEDKTFGICELTGKPIKKTRLEELPWTRHSIEGAREMERRSGFRG